MIGAARLASAIAHHPDLPPRRLASTYLRLRAGRSNRARVFGCDIAHVSRAALVRLYEEIYLLRAYPFRPRPDAIVVDGGANVGVATLYFKTVAPDAQVIAFEPEPNAFRLLTENVVRNRLRDVTCLQVALAAEAGPVELRSLSPAFIGATTAYRHDWPTVTVQAETLSSHLPSRVDFLKLDIEGAEVDVVGELVASGAIDRVHEIAVEHHHANGPESLPRLLGMLADSGFVYRVATAGERFWDEEQHVLVHGYRGS